jgi:hypothetical protein
MLRVDSVSRGEPRRRISTAVFPDFVVMATATAATAGGLSLLWRWITL